jgi:hypothetical protein
MRHNRNSFYGELTPLANAIRSKCATPVAPAMTLSEAAEIGIKAEAVAREKRAAKLARRAARANKECKS